MFAVAGLVAFQQVVDDEAFAGFAEPEFVAELDGGVGFAAYDDVHVGVVEAEDFVFVFEFASADDALVGLFDGGVDLGE